jgi:hypothetical protein
MPSLAPLFFGAHNQKAGSQCSRRPREIGNIVPGAYALELAKHAKQVPLNDSLANQVKEEI